MADSKISEFVSATDLGALDVLPLVQAGANKKITAGTFAANLPSVGNKGITKDTMRISTSVIPLTGTLFKLGSGAHTLSAGTQGQELVLLFPQTASISLTGAGFLSISGIAGSSVTLRYDTEWYITGSNSITTA